MHPPPAFSARSLLTLGGFAVAVAVAAGLGGVAASSASSTYAALDLPPYAPPAWLFGPVWTVLYVMIAASAWVLWRAAQTRGAAWSPALTAWAVQLVLNAAWTPIFFAGDRYGLALVEIVVLLAAVVVTIALARRERPAAAWLLVPYVAWVAFATALNAGIVILN
ncbi:tryptophan-rich sensory protein [Nocardioidaceae bacterium]|nr:tryptophan-rich sensory protein [Nocardioidaceae bacterium]